MYVYIYSYAYVCVYMHSQSDLRPTHSPISTISSSFKRNSTPSQVSNIYIFIYMCVYVSMYVYICSYTYVYVYMHSPICADSLADLTIFSSFKRNSTPSQVSHIYIHIYVCICIYVCMCIYTAMHMCVYICIVRFAPDSLADLTIFSSSKRNSTPSQVRPIHVHIRVCICISVFVFM